MVDLVLVWFHFDVTCGLFWSHFGSWWPLVVSFGHLSWPCFGLICGLIFGLILVSFLVPLVASFWTHFGLIFGSSCGLIFVLIFGLV